jgi:hypothetical protein
MSQVLDRVRALVRRGQVEVSLHGLKELTADEILLDDVIASIDAAVVVESYPAARRGPSVLVLQRDRDDNPLHILWGISKDTDSPAVLITAYRPDPSRWATDFMRRTKR